MNSDDKNYNSSEDEDYVPPFEDEEDDKDDLKYDDVEDELITKNCEKTEKNKETTKDEKERIDLLWEEFLLDTNNASSSTKLESINLEAKPSDTTTSFNTINNSIKSKNTQNFTETVEKYIFAGEEIEIKKKTPLLSTAELEPQTESRKHKWTPKVKSSGIAKAANLLTKKKKMSVIDKTNYDWKEYVEKEDLSEDFKIYNKSKEAYLDKQDFLLQADYCQFEREKALRHIERNKKN